MGFGARSGEAEPSQPFSHKKRADEVEPRRTLLHPAMANEKCFPVLSVTKGGGRGTSQEERTKTIHEIRPVGTELPQLQERLGCCAGHAEESGGNAKC